MNSFDECFDRLLGHEGAYSNNPADPGGETMWGVTVAVARAAGYTGPMKLLPVGLAKSIYLNRYWAPIKADQLPENLRFEVFDAAVNSGVSQAAKWLQRAVGTTTDGVIGPATIAAAKAAGPMLAAHYNGARLQMMTDLAGWPEFSRGWARRVAGNLMRLEA